MEIVEEMAQPAEPELNPLDLTLLGKAAHIVHDDIGKDRHRMGVVARPAPEMRSTPDGDRMMKQEFPTVGGPDTEIVPVLVFNRLEV